MTGKTLPKVVIVLSGKRKSGKDFVAATLCNIVGSDKCEIIHLSGPLKRQYAEEKGLDYEQLLTSSGYKELYREDMIKWGEAKRNMDSSYFCALAALECAGKQIWIIADARRKTDINFFKTNYADSKILLVRIEASETVRKLRGWEHTQGIDDKESECGLDEVVDWDYIIENNNDSMHCNPKMLELQAVLVKYVTK